MNKVLGIFIAALGLAIAIVPSFTDCPDSMPMNSTGGMGTSSMGTSAPVAPPCHASATAEIFAGVPLVIIGSVMSFTKRKTGFLTLSILGVVVGAATIALPSIVGTCSSPTMLCNTLMKPTLTALGLVAMAGSLGGLVLMRKASP